MNVVLLFLLFFYVQLCEAKAVPYFLIKYLSPLPRTIYYGETAYIPIELSFSYIGSQINWVIPTDTYLQKIEGHCPIFADHNAEYWQGLCYFNLVVHGTTLGKQINGSLVLTAKHGKQGESINLGALNIKVIPHCPSMLNIPLQYATANQEFVLPLAPYVQFYNENIWSNVGLRANLSPSTVDGLTFDPAQFSLRGIPARIGTYSFNVAVNSNNCTAQSTTIRVEVGVNLKDKPVFKRNISLITAMPRQAYQMNLVELLEKIPGFMVQNQVHFRIKPDGNNASWLHISPTNPTLLEGQTPPENAGQTAYVTVIASTNTGGDSEPLTLAIPIAHDPAQKPQVDSFSMYHSLGSAIDMNLTPYVTTVNNEPWELFIDKIEPLAPWLEHTRHELTGLIPFDVAGQLYNITLRVSTALGGSSKPVTIPLQVAINKEQTPHFTDNPLVLPPITLGQEYHYDFTLYQDVIPNNVPYQIELALDNAYAGFVTIKDNILRINNLLDFNVQEISLYVLIKNLPGGQSNKQKINIALLSPNAPDVRN